MVFDSEQLTADRRRVLIAVNRTAGAGKRTSAAEHLASELIAMDFEPAVVSSLEELSQLTEQLQCSGQLRAVVAVGGDGTAAEIVNRTPTGTPIAVLPTGTENLLAGYLRISKDAQEFAKMIAQGRNVWLDAGRANGRIFLLLISAGFDAEVVHRLHSTRTGNIRHWSYLKPIWESIRKYQYPALRVTCAQAQPANDDAPNWSQPIDCRWVFAFNLPRYGFGLKFAAEANGSDGQFDVRTFRRGGLACGLGYLASIVLGFHTRLPGVEAFKCARLRIESDWPVHYELDGDPGGLLPVEIDIVPRRLRLIVPSDFSPT